MTTLYKLKRDTFFNWYFRTKSREHIASFLSPYFMSIVHKDVHFTLGDLLKDAVNSVNDLQQTAGAERTAFEMGDPNVTLAQTMISASKASIGFEATVQVRNKFVEAYKEIMNMPV